MKGSSAANEVNICRLADASGYLPQIDRADADADFCNDVSQNGAGIHAICRGDDVIGLANMREGAEAFVYVYIFPQHRRRGYGYLAVCALEQRVRSGACESIATAYDGRNDIAKRLAEKCGYVKKSASSVMKYSGPKFDIPQLPVRNHRDEDFFEAFTMSAEAFHVMRVETGHCPDSVPYAADEEMRQYCLETADDRYVYVVDGEIVACAHIEGAEIDNVATKITHQGKGYGRNLVKFLVNVILEKDIGEPFLYCLEVNRKARKLYDSLGFKEIFLNEFAVKKISN